MKIDVLDKGHVEYIDHMGDDRTVANSARVSFASHKDSFDKKDEKLINYLAEHNHWTPFAHPQITLRVKAPIPIRTQFFKSKVGFCISGDTEITFIKKTGKKRSDGYNRSNGTRHRTVESLYEQWMQETPHSRCGDIYGHRKKIKRQLLRTLNTETGVFEESNITDIVCNGKKDVFEITTEDGKKLKATKDHRIYTKEGWMRLEDAVGLENRNNNWGMTKECWVGINGTKYAGTGAYREYEWMKEQRDLGCSVQEIADNSGCSYHTIRKWLKRHGLQFDPLENLNSFGGTPWNRGLVGAVKWSDEKKRKQSDILLQYYKDNPKTRQNTTWRQGVNRWTSQIAHQIHKAYNWTCQVCGERGKKLNCHHIVPVIVDESLAKDKSNLITVCVDCHKEIHKSSDNEMMFAEQFQIQPIKKAEWKSRGHGTGLRVHFTKIVSVRYIGEEVVYDISVNHSSHNFVANGMVVHNCENEVSRRYVSIEPEFYHPRWRTKPDKSMKQGSGDFIDSTEEGGETSGGISYHPLYRDYEYHMKASIKLYEDLITMGVAPEQARFALPQGMFTEWYWTGSLSAYARFYKLRIHPHSQWEIRQYAKAISEIIKPLFPVSWKALTN
jgi:thymidylate synthase (FAD)